MHAKTLQRASPSSLKSVTEIGGEVLNKALPSAIRHALKNYRTMAFAEASEDAKTFQQHQAACKSALAHIEALLKLAGLIEAAGKSGVSEVFEFGSLLADAEAAVEAYEKPETHDHEGG
jgi:hypothetical protein